MNIRLWCSFNMLCEFKSEHDLNAFVNRTHEEYVQGAERHLSSILFVSSMAMVPELKYAETYVDYSLHRCFLQICFWQFSFAIFFFFKKSISMATADINCPLHLFVFFVI